MSQQAYQELQRCGQFSGAFIVLVGIILMFAWHSAWFFIAAYTLFWLLNHVVIHHYVGNYLLAEQLAQPRTKTLIDPI